MSDHHKESPISAMLEEENAPESVIKTTGFLSIETNWFDRLFISIVIWVALSLFWFRFIEPMGLTIWISNTIAAAVAFIIIKKG
jgi:predicted small integral membrane protein